MADLGAIGRQPATVRRLIPLTGALATPTGVAFSQPVVYTCRLDIADARNITLAKPRAIAMSIARYSEGRKATYLDLNTQIRGFVRNASAVGIARRVLIFDAAGHCVGKTDSSASDGSFKITVDNQGSAITLCVALPDTGDNRNAVVKWAVVPVTAT